jgi:DNA polymerase III subunit alpha
MLEIRPPERFVGLHAHTGFSVFDGIGYPSDHINFVLENGMDAWTITDHGNANGHAHARKHFTKLAKKGHKYRQLYGVEFYFVPDIEEWDAARADHKAAVAAAKKGKVVSEEEDQGHVVESEEDTRTNSAAQDEWKRRYHLVVFAKNQTGMHNLYTLVKKSYKYGFYRFPRIDFRWLKEHGEGLVVSTACVGGYPSSLVFREFPDKKFEELVPSLLDGPESVRIMNNLENMVDRFVDAVGQENFNLEIQFNKLPAQHLVNKALIALMRKTGIPLVATADSHYYRPDLWEARELYKGLGWRGKKDDGLTLPSREDLKCELYPKNAAQMWEEYLLHKDTFPFYEGTEEIVRDSIERTHDIAWQQCEDTWIDTSVKLPDFSKPGDTAFNQLLTQVKKGMVDLELHKKPEYVARIKEEMEDIKFLGFENYFLVMNEVFHIAADETLFGCGRGSASGSLVNYVLGITQVDPIQYGLLWARFLGRHRCLTGETLIKTSVGHKRLDEVQVGDLVLTHNGELKPVTDAVQAAHDIAYKIKVNGEEIICAPNHKWIVVRYGKQIEVMACELRQGDSLVTW